jgi:tRNA(Ile)-lysidine synthetase-like protein
MKKVLAVSGGVDSMVLLEMFRDDPDVVVAHFNHGTRPSADDDQAFVEAAAKQYNKPFFTKKENLGADVSESHARERRYSFLFNVARKNDGVVYTAHHLNDLAESVIINLTRGTGWRGLAPLSSDQKIAHPFLENEPLSKSDILKYAAKHNISFREDPTNHEDNYLRNRIRTKFAEIEPAEKQTILETIYKLWLRQREIKTEVEAIEADYLKSANGTHSRAFFKNLDKETALELLKAITGETEPTNKRFLDAIINFAPEKTFNLPKDKYVTIHKTYFKY